MTTTTCRYTAADYTAMRWKNGAGTTTELARDTADGDYGWRLSIADIADDGAFSTFPGMQRIITVLEGAGMELDVDGRASGKLRPFAAYPFDGSSRTGCTLLDGPVRDFNLIYRTDSFSSRFEWLTAAGNRSFLTTAPTVLIFNVGEPVVAGAADDNGQRLGHQELLRVDGGGPAEIRLETGAGSQCAVIELWPQ